MCTNKILYKAGDATVVAYASKKNDESSMNFHQVTFATDCLKMLANRMEIPIVQLAEKMTEKGLFPKFHELLGDKHAYSKVQVVNRLQKLV